ncbi:MAG: HNH endonuclease [Caldilineaceae bacterium]|nr:HNH endonuclease [Caldilineaceae bacterium]
MTSYIPTGTQTHVIARAKASCEYCLIHSNYAALTHEVDHIVAEKHGGSSEEANLAYSCAQCNRFKGSDLASIDPRSGKIVPLFNLRTDNWSEHFTLDGPVIMPLTQNGRATERLLQLNQIDRILLRRELLNTGRYPFQFGK